MIPWNLEGTVDTPHVAVVVPTMGRPSMLRRCLLALLSQTLEPQRVEIIVANDRPDEKTERVVEALRQSHKNGPMLHYLAVTDGTGPAHARNLGWRYSVAPIIAFTDDDTIPDPRWLEEGLRVMQKENAAAAAGRIIVPLPDEPTDYELDASGLERAEFVTANCFVRRELLRECQGFDERYAAAWREDADLQFHCLERGYRIARATWATVVHPVRPAGFGVSLKQQRKVQFDALLYRKYKGLYRERIRRSPRYDYYLTVALLLVGLVGAAVGNGLLATICLGAWALLTLRLCLRRLRHTSHAPMHVLEMLVTSAAIPPLAVFWRMVGNFRFRVLLL